MASYTKSTLTEVEEELSHVQPPHGGNGINGTIPPEDTKYTGGGGEGDDYKKHGEGHRGPKEILYRHRLSLFAVLIGDAMFFIGAVGVFLVNKSYYHVNSYGRIVQEWKPVALPSILWLNTLLLVLSSVTMEKARLSYFHESDLLEEWLGFGKPVTRKSVPWLVATLLLGLGFLAGQVVAWKQLLAGPIGYTGLSKQNFYLLTGLHAAHVVIAILAITACLIAMKTLKKLELRQVLVDCTGWFWHAMGVLWLLLFALLEWYQ